MNNELHNRRIIIIRKSNYRYWPIKKHKHSDILVSNIDGPTSPKILPTCSCMVSSSHFGFFSYVWIKIKILSTPTANTKNGITYNMYYTYVLHRMYTGKIILHSIFFDTRFNGEKCRWHSYITKYTKRTGNRRYYNDNAPDTQHYFAVCLKSIMKNSIQLEKHIYFESKETYEIFFHGTFYLAQSQGHVYEHYHITDHHCYCLCSRWSFQFILDRSLRRIRDIHEFWSLFGVPFFHKVDESRERFLDWIAIQFFNLRNIISTICFDTYCNWCHNLKFGRISNKSRSNIIIKSRSRVIK